MARQETVADFNAAFDEAVSQAARRIVADAVEPIALYIAELKKEHAWVTQRTTHGVGRFRDYNTQQVAYELAVKIAIEQLEDLHADEISF